MIITSDTYGSDADGNRGMDITTYEIDADDHDDIKTQLIDKYWEEGYLSDKETIELICPYTEDSIEFEVIVNDYVDMSLLEGV